MALILTFSNTSTSPPVDFISPKAQQVPPNPDLQTKISVGPEQSETLDWNGSDDRDNPFNWPLHRKWIVTVLALFAAFTCTMNGTMITVAHEAINERFHVSDKNFPNSYWPVTSWALGGALFSLFILPLMEDFGVRLGFLGTYVVFVCFLIPQAVAQNFATLIVTRFFGGGCVAVLATTAVSVVGNIWATEQERTLPVALFVTSYVAGSSAGPAIGGVIFAHLSWRWISYFQLIMFIVLFPLYWVFFKESRGIVILEQRSRGNQHAPHTNAKHKTKDQRMKDLSQRMRISAGRPLTMLLTEWVVFILTIWSAFIIGTVYMFTQSTEAVFVSLYGWNASQAGYVQIAVVIGECIGCAFTQLTSGVYFASSIRNQEIPGQPIPEARLYMSIIASFVGITGGMFVYAWTAYASIPWIAPTIGLAMVGFGSTVVLTAVADYLVDAYCKYAASAAAALVFVENIMAAFLPLATQTMYSELGLNWASALLGFFAFVLSFAPVCIILLGKQIRARSPFMKEAIFDKKRELSTYGSIRS